MKCLIYAETWSEVPAHLLFGLVQPYGTLWFIYMLPVFFVVTRLLRELGMPIPVIVLAGILLEVAPIETGSIFIDEFAARFVYFVLGCGFAESVFSVARWADRNRLHGLALIGLYGLITATLVSFTLFGHVMAALPLISFGLGLAGAFVMAMTAALLTPTPVGNLLARIGAQSLAIYLAFFLPMVVTRIALVKFVPGWGAGPIAAMVTLSALIFPLLLNAVITRFGIGSFLFARPAFLRLKTASEKAAADRETGLAR